MATVAFMVAPSSTRRRDERTSPAKVAVSASADQVACDRAALDLSGNDDVARFDARMRVSARLHAHLAGRRHVTLERALDAHIAFNGE